MNRGFDSFLGYYNGLIDYYNYSYIEPAFDASKPGFDWRRNSDTMFDAKLGVYATDVFTDEATKIIDDHSKTKKPLFLMINHLAPHTGKIWLKFLFSSLLNNLFGQEIITNFFKRLKRKLKNSSTSIIHSDKF